MLDLMSRDVLINVGESLGQRALLWKEPVTDRGTSNGGVSLPDGDQKLALRIVANFLDNLGGATQLL